MRTLVLTFGILLGASTLPVTHGNGSLASAPMLGAMVVLDAQAAAQSPAEQQAQPPQIKVEVNRGGGHGWYANPVWMAIGGIALVLVILLIVMAARGGGGGTTVVRG